MLRDSQEIMPKPPESNHLPELFYEYGIVKEVYQKSDDLHEKEKFREALRLIREQIFSILDTPEKSAVYGYDAEYRVLVSDEEDDKYSEPNFALVVQEMIGEIEKNDELAGKLDLREIKKRLSNGYGEEKEGGNIGLRYLLAVQAVERYLILEKKDSGLSAQVDAILRNFLIKINEAQRSK